MKRHRKLTSLLALIGAIALTVANPGGRISGKASAMAQAPLIGSYDLTLALTQDQPPFPIWTGGKLVITSADPLVGTISIPQLNLQDEGIQGASATQQGNDGQVTTTFTFTIQSTGQKFYGMQVKQKLYGSTTVPAASAARHRVRPAGDPGEDACWLATHSGA